MREAQFLWNNGKVRDSRFEETANGQPLVLRAHHLFNLAEFRHRNIDIFDIARGSREARENDSKRSYARDVLGDTIEDADRYEVSEFTFFNGFHKSPDTRKVKISCAQKDGICESCAFGKHCSITVSAIISEEQVFNEIMRVATNEGLLEEIDVFWETVKPMDAEPGRAKAAITTMGVVRQLITAFPARLLKQYAS